MFALQWKCAIKLIRNISSFSWYMCIYICKYKPLYIKWLNWFNVEMEWTEMNSVWCFHSTSMYLKHQQRHPFNFSFWHQLFKLLFHVDSLVRLSFTADKYSGEDFIFQIQNKSNIKLRELTVLKSLIYIVSM